MNITKHIETGEVPHRAVVSNEFGETVARFMGDYCVDNAELFDSAFRAGGALKALADSCAWRIDRDNAVIAVRMWRAGKVYLCERPLPDMPTPVDVLLTMADAVEGAARLAANGAK